MYKSDLPYCILAVSEVLLSGQSVIRYYSLTSLTLLSWTSDVYWKKEISGPLLNFPLNFTASSLREVSTHCVGQCLLLCLRFLPLKSRKPTPNISIYSFSVCGGLSSSSTHVLFSEQIFAYLS